MFFFSFCLYFFEKVYLKIFKKMKIIYSIISFIIIMKSIKFGNKKALQIVSNDMKNTIKNEIKDTCAMEITTRYYNFLNEKNMHLLKDNTYKVCINTFGHKYLLFLTKYNNKNYCIFVNKKKEDMIHIRFRFKDELFTNTLFDGELIKNKDDNWVYVITDIMAYKGECILKNKILDERIELLKNVYDNDYAIDEMMDFCKIDIKKYFDLKYLDDIHKRYLQSVPYKCSGIYFQHNTDYKKSFMYIFPEFRTIQDSSTTQTSTSSNIQTKNEPVEKKIIEPNKKFPFNFQIRQTDLPDIYQLYYKNKDKMINYGYAGVPNMETSKLLSDIFEKMDPDGTKDDNIKVVGICEFSEKFGKWIPKKITHQDVGNVGNTNYKSL